jgi:hypothetical protein
MASFSFAMSFDCRHRILPDQDFLRGHLAEITSTRAHVTVSELEPCTSERVSELVRVLVEATGDLCVLRVVLESKVSRRHDRSMTLVRIVGIRHGVGHGSALRDPLLGTGWALGQFPVVFEKDLEVVVVPLGRVGGPSAFDT